MKKKVIYGLCFLTFLWGCNSADKHNHSEHRHSQHEHSHDGHDHSNEGHTHKHGEHDHSHEGHNHSHERHSHSHEGLEGEEIIFTPTQAKAAGIVVTTVTPTEFSQVIKVSGQILPASGDEVTVPATSNGIVSFYRSAISEGLSVRSGESLLAISGKGLTDGDPIARAKATFLIAEKEYERANTLINDKLISQREYNEIKLAYENAKIAYDGSAKRITDKGTDIVSPISGFIKSRLVSEGEYVTEGQPLFTVTQNRKLQLRADVSERYFSSLKSITSANFKTPYTDKTHKLSDLNGRLLSYGKSAGNEQFHIPINFEFDNVGDIISGVYVEVFLLGKARQHVISIPATALTETLGLYYVYIQLDEEGYQRKEVKLGESNGELVEILSGLKTGDRVVTKGANHIKLAAASSSIPHGHEH
jgi:RND family efflux transporter, MFP subunit